MLFRSEGKVLEGSLDRDTEKSVARELHKGGLVPLYVGARRRSEGVDVGALFRRRPGARDRLFFTQELSTLLNAGLPLDRALAICAEVTERAVFRNVIQEVLRKLKSGTALAESLGAHPEIFSDLYVNMVRAGEASGSLGPVMERLARSEEAGEELRSYLISALIYPALLTLVGAGSVALMLGFVIPKFAQVFTDSNLPLPAPTRMLLALSDWSREYGWILLAAVVAAVAAFRVARSEERRVGKECRL